jgi:hypothetical protein
VISDAMYHKAERLIAADCLAAWEKSNPKATRQSGHGKKRFKPYANPARVDALVKAMDKGNAEQVAAIMLNQFNHKLSEAEL